MASTESGRFGPIAGKKVWNIPRVSLVSFFRLIQTSGSHLARRSAPGVHEQPPNVPQLLSTREKLEAKSLRPFFPGEFFHLIQTRGSHLRRRSVFGRVSQTIVLWMVTNPWAPVASSRNGGFTQANWCRILFIHGMAGGSLSIGIQRKPKKKPTKLGGH